MTVWTFFPWAIRKASPLESLSPTFLQSLMSHSGMETMPMKPCCLSHCHLLWLTLVCDTTIQRYLLENAARCSPWGEPWEGPVGKGRLTARSLTMLERWQCPLRWKAEWSLKTWFSRDCMTQWNRLLNTVQHLGLGISGAVGGIWRRIPAGLACWC